MKNFLVLFILYFSLIQMQNAQSIDGKFWETDGTVNTVFKNQNKLYVGGKFNYVGPNTGAAVLFNNQTKTSYNFGIKISGIVHAVAKDISGKIYFGGEFESMGRKNLLVLNADGSLNALNVPIDGPVKSLFITSDILLVGGSFSKIGNANRSNCGAINTNNGQVLSLSPNPDGEVKAFTIAGAEVIIGGSFSNVMNQTRNGLASFSLSSGSLQSLNNSFNGSVNCLKYDNGILYVGGNFNTVDTCFRNNFAAIDLVYNSVLPLNPNIGGVVNSIETTSNSIFIGGAFSSVGLEFRNNMAEIDKSTGFPTLFDPSPSGEVKSLTMNNSNLFVGGSFDFVSNNTASNFAQLNLTGDFISTTKFNNSVSAIAVSSDTIITGGNFSSFGGESRQNFATFDYETGALLSYYPKVNGEVKTIQLYSGNIAIGGNFTYINNINRSGFALIDTLTGDPISVLTNVVGRVNKAVIIGNSAYLAGSFSYVNAVEKSNLVKISLIDGSVDSWNFNANEEVLNLKFYGDYLYAMGNFSQINNLNRRGVCRFNLSNGGSIDTWNPDVNNNVYDIVQDGSQIYMGGAFTQFSNNSQSYLTAVDTSNALPINGFNPVLNSEVNALEFDGDILYAGGQSYGGLKAFHVANNQEVGINFNGEFQSINELKFVNENLFISGSYRLNNGNIRSNFSAIKMTATTPNEFVSNIQFKDITPIGMKLFFQKGNGTKHLVIGRQGSAVNALPQNGKDYISSNDFGVGTSIGSGNYVLSNSSDTFVDVKGLNIGTSYYFAVYEANGLGTFVKYALNNPTTASAATISGYEPPTISATAITAVQIKTNAMKIKWTNGNGSKRIVLAKQGSSVNATPSDSLSYVQSQNFGDGYELGTGNFVVYNGEADSLELFNLNAGSTYYFSVVEYNGIDAFCRFKKTNPATASFTTVVPAAEPTTASANLTFSEIGTESVKLNWTAGNGIGRIVIASESVESNSNPVDGEIYYTDGNFTGNSYAFSSNEKVVYVGAGASASVNGLTPGATYYFSIFEWNGADYTTNYATQIKLTGSVKMKVPGTPPVNPSRALYFTRASSNSIYMKWTSGKGSGRVVFAKKGGLPNFKPVSGISYRADSKFGNGDSLTDGIFAVYDGNSDSAFVTNLEPNTVYGFEVFEYNVGDFGNNYQVDSFAYGLKSTLPVSGLNNFFKINLIKVYPNPVTSSLNIELAKPSKSKIEFQLFDLSGKLVLRNSFPSSGNQNFQLDVTGIENGNYILTIINGKETHTQSVIVSK